jgi:hypothetical protein
MAGLDPAIHEFRSVLASRRENHQEFRNRGMRRGGK